VITNDWKEKWFLGDGAGGEDKGKRMTINARFCGIFHSPFTLKPLEMK
jgi:hypothetical protein